MHTNNRSHVHKVDHIHTTGRPHGQGTGHTAAKNNKSRVHKWSVTYAKEKVARVFFPPATCRSVCLWLLVHDR